MVSILVPHINEIKNPIPSSLLKNNYDITFSLSNLFLISKF